MSVSDALTFGSVCSGIGGAEVAWSRLGWRSRWCAEIDPFASAVLAARFPRTPNLGDFTKIRKGVDADAVDVLGGGTPCQSFSVAGLRKGLDDARGDLTLEFLGLVGRLLPRWVVWENVPGVLSIDGGRTFGAVLGLLGELGYGFAYRVLDAQYFGLAQRRRRVFVVAYRGDWRPPAAVLFERDSMSGNLAPGRETGADVAGTLGCGSPASGGRVGPDEVAAHQVVATLLANGGRGSRQDKHPMTVMPLDVAHALRADGFDASEDGTGRGTPLVAYALRRDAGRDGEAKTPSADADGLVRLRDPGFSVYENLAPTVDHAPHSVATFMADDYRTGSYEETETARPLTTSADRTRSARPLTTSADRTRSAPIALTPFDPKQIGHPANFSNPKPGDPCHPLRSVANCEPAIAIAFDWQKGNDVTNRNPSTMNIETERTPTLGSTRTPAVQQATSAVRRLTPRECERLQGFPDDWTLVPYRGKPAADGPRYRAIGNAWPVPVVEWIGARIALCDTVLREAEVAA